MRSKGLSAAFADAPGCPGEWLPPGALSFCSAASVA